MYRLHELNPEPVAMKTPFVQCSIVHVHCTLYSVQCTVYNSDGGLLFKPIFPRPLMSQSRFSAMRKSRVTFDFGLSPAGADV